MLFSTQLLHANAQLSMAHNSSQRPVPHSNLSSQQFFFLGDKFSTATISHSERSIEHFHTVTRQPFPSVKFHRLLSTTMQQLTWTHTAPHDVLHMIHDMSVAQAPSYVLVNENNTHNHTHTCRHTHRQRERKRERKNRH